MVFTGDWNGGERKFNVRIGQHLNLEKITRIDPVTGEARPLVEGNLDQVDHYAWTKGNTLRWRSRLPSDPPFQQTAIPYVLDYTVSGVLEKNGDRYQLWHDFAFPERSGEIETFSLDLTLDPAWGLVTGYPGHLERRHLAPGDSVLVKMELTYQGAAGGPKDVRAVTPAPLRLACFAAALLAMALLYLSFRRSQQALGRFATAATPPGWDEEWLRQNVFLYQPEEVGALWDRSVGAPEVAAVLARLVAEGKLASEVRPKRSIFGKDVLVLKLKSDRNAFGEYERKLIDKLFFGGRTETDTEAVREHYKSSGFDPAGVIRPGLEKRLETHSELAGKVRPGGRGRTLALLLAALVLFGLDIVRSPQGGAVAGIVLFGAFWFYLAGLIAAVFWRKRIENLDAGALTFVIPGLGLFALCVLATFFDDWLPARLLARPGLFGDLALALLPVAAWSSLLNNARSRESASAIERRKILAAARRMFQRELGERQPRLQDEWLPYLLAFGLQHDMDRWAKAFGGEHATTYGGMTSTSTSSFGSSGGSGWTGGGGSFGGAGSSASWAAAATGLAAGVSAPSSSSGGGGGGGGSSGGGGGGGW